MLQPKTVYLALGSNLNEPATQLKRALEKLAALPQIKIIAVSPFYQTKPMGPQNQDDFVNAVACLHTALDAKDLFCQLKNIEKDMGRTFIERWGPRIIDLDLLLYDQLVYADTELTIPHPGIGQRLFVLKPLHDIAPDLHLPDGTAIKDLLAQQELINELNG